MDSTLLSPCQLLLLTLLVLGVYQVEQVGGSHNAQYPCSVAEESRTGTFICDLLPLYTGKRARGHVTSGVDSNPQDELPESEPFRMTLINNIHSFAIRGSKLYTQGRVDREQYIKSKLCQDRSVEVGLSDAFPLHANEDEDTVKMICVVVVELAVFEESSNKSGPNTEAIQFLRVPVLIIDVNDHPPEFDQHKSGIWLEVDEDVSQSPSSLTVFTGKEVGDKVGLEQSKMQRRARDFRTVAMLPLAKDWDFAENGTVRYALAGIDAEFFELVDNLQPLQSEYSASLVESLREITSISLITRYELDREKCAQHQLTLLAHDMSTVPGLRHTTQLSITVRIREVNEFSPVFRTPESRASIAPDSLLSHPRVKAQWLPCVPGMAQIASEYAPVGECAQNSMLKVVLDIPEDIPVGTHIYRFIATDQDESDGLNSTVKLKSKGRVQYALAAATNLKARRYFRIGSDDGWLLLMYHLDYETGPRGFDLPIIALDWGRPQRTGSISVAIRLTDVNDEVPVIKIHQFHSKLHLLSPELQLESMKPSTQRYQLLAVKEDSPVGTFVAKVTASDRDRGSAGEVSCVLVDAYDYPADGFSTGDAYRHSSRITDSLNTVFFLQPIDRAKTLDYAGGSGDEFTGPRSTEYNLITNQELDREKTAQYFLSIVCHDHGESVTENSASSATNTRQSSVRMIKVFILDVNDNGPKFTNSYFSAEVEENSPTGTLIIQLKAVDPDSVGQIRYRLATADDLASKNVSHFDLNNLAEEFTVDSLSGRVTTKTRNLDREKVSNYTLPVVAYDEEFPSRSSLARIRIRVTDVNDNPPILTRNTTFLVMEETSSTKGAFPMEHTVSRRHVYIGQLTASDSDIGDNGVVTFSLLPTSQGQSPADSVQWLVRADGSLFALSDDFRPLDRERQAVHLIPVLIKDGGKPVGLSATLTVTVLVQDRNDNAPVFYQPKSSRLLAEDGDDGRRDQLKDFRSQTPTDLIELPEDTSPGTVLYTVLANDTDENENGHVVYSLEKYQGVWQLLNGRRHLEHRYGDGVETEHFLIDAQTGKLRLNQRVSVGDTSVPRQLIVYAEDCGEPQLRSYAFLRIQVVSEARLGPAGKSAQNKAYDLTGTATNQDRHISDSAENSSLHDISVKHVQGVKSSQDHTLLLNSHFEQGLVQERSQQSRQSSWRSWSAEVINVLGIGLIVIILVCLLLLITYAIHGTKIFKCLKPTVRKSSKGHSVAQAGDKSDNSNARDGLFKMCGSMKNMLPSDPEQNYCGSTLQSKGGDTSTQFDPNSYYPQPIQVLVAHSPGDMPSAYCGRRSYDPSTYLYDRDHDGCQPASPMDQHGLVNHSGTNRNLYMPCSSFLVPAAATLHSQVPGGKTSSGEPLEMFIRNPTLARYPPLGNDGASSGDDRDTCASLLTIPSAQSPGNMHRMLKPALKHAHFSSNNEQGQMRNDPHQSPELECESFELDKMKSKHVTEECNSCSMGLEVRSEIGLKPKPLGDTSFI